MKLRMAAFALASLALAMAPAFASTESDIMTYCKSDVERLCKGVPMGGGKIMDCLKAHEKQMSVGCAQALEKMKGK